LQQIRTFWDGLNARRRVIALLSAAAIASAIFGIGRVATTPSMSLLYSGLEPAAAGEVVAALEAQGVPFEVRGDAIYVPGERRDQVRMGLASEGLPANGPSGYELLDALSGFGTTSQMFDAAYWRAREGELARTITASANVRAARVHIANPVNQPFARERKGSASVTVTMASGALEAEQAKAVRYLVSSAVPGLEPESVTVIDAARGMVLGGGDDGLAKDPALDPDQRAETLRRNILRLLEARVGAGHVIVEVNVDADMNAETVSERVIDPESRVAISSEVEESEENAQGGSAGVTVASNLPDGDVEGSGGENARSASQSRERMNFEVSETRRERIIQPGQVRRISVAVMVDGMTSAAGDGAPVWAPRPAEEIETLRQLVQAAIGYDAERGDTVTIESLQFSAPAEQGVLAERPADGFLTRHGGVLAQVGVLGLVVMALIFFVLRPMLSRREPEPLAALGAPDDRVAAGAQATAAIEAGGEILELPATAVSKIDRLREVIAERSEESTTVLRNWIEAPDRVREPAGS
jgi:flagellar M-ring protein FliF